MTKNITWIDQLKNDTKLFETIGKNTGFLCVEVRHGLDTEDNFWFRVTSKEMFDLVEEIGQLEDNEFLFHVSEEQAKQDDRLCDSVDEFQQFASKAKVLKDENIKKAHIAYEKIVAKEPDDMEDRIESLYRRLGGF